ncbi:zinc finger protein 99 isoform X1 [Dunckerocampus dactyliophorus]|uniref:zinc finger protein 99 isoform X1 n=1 Tax=Dunckerocampus dactyliophorus TaxID=161453 RepID=UPI00240735F7|nr:zinc finger protein 99 isoform X1 [Dunckerocampus dactyliophorus]
MDEATAEVMKDVPAEEQSIALDVTSSNNSTTPVEGTADGLFCCQDCGETFREEAGYLEHRHQHPDGSCLMYLEPVEDLDDADKVGESTNYCHLCSQSFVNLSEFHSHMENHHSQPSSTQQISGVTKQHTFECAECGKSYSMLGHYLNHQRTHIQASKSLFKDLEHLKKKSFQCESCGRSYSRQSALDAHRRCHEEKLIKPRNRTSEELIPTAETVVEAKPVEKQTRAAPEKLVNCPCGKSFSSLQGLKTHQRFSHSSQCCTVEAKAKQRKNVFYCKECRKMFHGHLAWFNHEKWHENRSEGSANRFPCEVCGKVFMTQTFYYRHHRMAHSDEAPAKSFLNQVGQLQKRAFECNDCGLKFSRPSAFHAHQLQHTNAFKETEGLTQMHVPVRQQMTLEGEQKETKILRYQADAENVLRLKGEEDPDANEEDTESYEPGDFNVLVISASESEDETVQDSHVEQGCESDQEARGFAETVEPPNPLVSKPELGLNIVQVDLESGKEQRPPAATEAEDKVPAKRLDCPDCYRWFTSEASLRAHLVWHSIHERRRKKGQSVEVYTCDNEGSSYAAGDSTEYKKQELEEKSVICDNCGVYFSHSSAYVFHQLHQPNRKQLLCQDCVKSSSQKASLLNHTNRSAQKKENMSITKVYNPKKTLLGPKIYHCEQCGKGFWSLGAYSHHKQNPSQCVDVRLRTGVAQPLHRGRSRCSLKVACPVCGRKFRHKGIMTLHMRIHENGNHKCDICNRSFRLFSSLLRHQVVHNEHLPPPIKSFQHQVEQLQKNTYSCPDCGKLFSREKALKFHMKYHGNESGQSPSPPRSTQEDLQCALCLTFFKNKASLRAHRKICLKKECHTTNYKTENQNNDPTGVKSQESSLHSTVVKKEMDTEELHIESPYTTRHLEKPTHLKYKCKKCDRSFSVIGALNLHKRIHAKGYRNKAKATLASVVSEEELRKDFPFSCSECGKRYMSNSALGSHKRWHSNKTFKVSSLKEQFSKHWLQDHHMSTLQPQPDISAKSEPQLDFSCPEGSLLGDDTDSQGGEASLESVSRLIPDGSEPASTTLVSKMYQCPLCSASFSKPRGLRAHKWQAHSVSAEDDPKNPADGQTEALSKVTVSVADNKNLPAGEEQKKLDASSLSSIPKLERGLQCSTAVVDDNKLCPESKMAVQAPEALAEMSLPLSRISEPTGKYLYKCGKCGKAFQTEGQLEIHKTKSKSRPFGCTLCCNAFWTDNQLQQHLTWHDQVRFRLPNEVRLRLSAALTSKSLKSARKSFRSPSPLPNQKCTHCQSGACDCSNPPVSGLQDLTEQHQASISDCRGQSDGPAPVSSGDSDGLTCLECGATFSQETDLHQHYSKHAQGMF